LGGAIFLPMFVALSLVRTFAAFQLPRFRGPESSVQPPSPAGAASRLKDAMKPFFILPLVGWSMVTSIHAVLNAFQGLLWKQQGFGADIIAPLLAIAAIAEAGLMFCFAPIVKRFSARSLILTSALVAVFRWVCMALQPGLEVLIVLQGLNAITFALGYMGCLHFIANWTSDDIAAEAQGFFQMLQQGMCVISLAAFGWLMELMGARAYFVAAGFSMLGAGLIYLSMRMHARKQVTDSKLA
jgi:PPP family 3-phenylpropionic acid transporter